MSSMFKLRVILYLLCSDYILIAQAHRISSSASIKYYRNPIRSAGAKQSPINPQPNSSSTTTLPTVSNGNTNSNSDSSHNGSPSTIQVHNGEVGNTDTTSTESTPSESHSPHPATVKSTESTQRTEPNISLGPSAPPISDNDDLVKMFETLEANTNPLKTTSIEDEIYEGILFNTETRYLASDVQKVVKNQSIESTPKIYRFEDPNFTVLAASHGLFFYYYGEALIFHDQFDHFIKFRLQKAINLEKDFTNKDCIEFLKSTVASFLNSNTSEAERLLYQEEKCEEHHDQAGATIFMNCQWEPNSRLKGICERLTDYYDRQYEEFQSIVSSAYEAFQHRMTNRNKRFVVALALVAAGALAVNLIPALCVMCEKHDDEKLWANVNKMEKELATVNEGLKVTNEVLSGLSKTVTNMEISLRNEMQLMNSNTRFQIMNVERAVREVSQELEREVRLEAIVKTLEDYINIRLSSLRNIINLELKQIDKWETIFNILNKGTLPRDLLGYNQLRNILNQIEVNLDRHFEFAIDNKNFPLYYTLPIVSYNLTELSDSFGLYIRIKIPLKITGVPHQFDIISINAHSFPCQNDECILTQGETEKGTLQTFDLPQTSLLVHRASSRIQHEINLDYLDCRDRGYKKTCWTFHPTMLQSPSSCTRAIYDWNETEIVTWCDFRPAKREEYKVIPISYNSYLIHKDLVPSFAQYCKDGQSRIQIEDWAMTYEIPKFCEVFIDSTNQKLLGPFSEYLRSHSSYVRYSLESQLIKKIKTKYINLTKIRVPFHDTGRFVRSIEQKFKLNENLSQETNARLNSEELSQMALYNMYVQNRLDKSLSSLDAKFKTYNLKGSFWGIISLIGDGIQMLTTITIIFGILSYTNAFGLIGATLIMIPPRPANAWKLQLIPDIKLLPDIKVDVLEDVTAISFFMGIVFVVLILVLSVFFIFFGTFRTIYYSQHYGRGTPLVWEGERVSDSIPYTLMLHLNYRGNLVRYVKVENIHIKVNIGHLFDSSVRRVKVKNPLLNWGIVKLEGMLVIELTETVHLIGFNDKNERVVERDYTVSLPIDVSTFTSVPKSEAIQKKGNNGIAFVDTVQKHKRVGIGKFLEAPPRYVELGHASNRILEETV